jgi:hypothetical protein
MTSAKWEKTIKNVPVFSSIKHNFGLFAPEVGDFLRSFFGQRFFDSFNGLRYWRWGGLR